LINWEEAPLFLSPDKEFDKNGAYSGSALVKDDMMHIFYTGNVKHKGDFDYINTGRENNTVHAVSKDGECVDSKNVIMFNKDYPDGLTLHVRDPKVFEYEGKYYMVLGARTKEDKGEVLVYESEDLDSWNHIRTFETMAKFGYMWECPDLFPLDGKWVLIMSPIEREREGNAYWNLNSTVAYIGQMDWDSGRFQVENQHEIDGGLDFYAPQTCLNSENERIMVAWMQMWQRNIPSHELGDGWAGAMSLPRQVRVMDNRLCQSIPSSVLAQFSEDKTWQGQLEPGQEFYLSDWVKSQQVLKLNLEAVTGAVFQLHYGGKSDYPEGLSLTWQADQALLTVKRDGVGHQIIGKEEPYLDSRLLDIWSDTPYRLELEIVRDTSSIEVFVNTKQVMSFTFYAEGLGTGIGLVSSQLVKVENLTNYSLI